ncbi:hypothetical protein [Dactylosporangium sp. CA-139066]
MFRFARRPAVPAGVRFCDGCAKVTTADQRARRSLDRTRTALTAITGPR